MNHPYYGGQQPAPSRGTPVVVWIGIAFALLVVFALFGIFAVGVAQGWRNAKAGAANLTTAPLSESRASGNGLVVAHYPQAFAAKKIGAESVLISRNLPDGTDEGLVLTAIENPVSDDLDELARIILKAGNGVIDYDGPHERTTPGTCLSRYPGVEVSGQFKVAFNTYADHVCIFISNGHAFEARSWTRTKPAKDSQAVLSRIEQATEVF